MKQYIFEKISNSKTIYVSVERTTIFGNKKIEQQVKELTFNPEEYINSYPYEGYELLSCQEVVRTYSYEGYSSTIREWNIIWKRS